MNFKDEITNSFGPAEMPETELLEGLSRTNRLAQSKRRNRKVAVGMVAVIALFGAVGLTAKAGQVNNTNSVATQPTETSSSTSTTSQLSTTTVAVAPSFGNRTTKYEGKTLGSLESEFQDPSGLSPFDGFNNVEESAEHTLVLVYSADGAQRYIFIVKNEKQAGSGGRYEIANQSVVLRAYELPKPEASELYVIGAILRNGSQLRGVFVLAPESQLSGGSPSAMWRVNLDTLTLEETSVSGVTVEMAG